MGFKPSKEEQNWATGENINIPKSLDKDDKNIFPDTDTMICPKDKITLESFELDQSGIIINKCSYCGGIWIDRISIERLFHSSKKTEILLVYLAKILNIEISEI